ncbi:glycine cleavage system aminomethyltransferase GcvT [Hyphococcus luteus]|uniref:aminomethyltransferase n=1 Tax=Hyphococcus luteus TaxID=2058213 RepID=A0A2S7K5H4_9PROT|nr:glycine cleavage system aminomethyltransferase GcvT [Marinicaulis flavus]PQA87764.1 glycine cleavage system protein T [Marinicaulis flavus]
MADAETDTLKRTPLYDLHVSLGAKMVAFAGYEMPVQYPAGVLKEHLHTREKAGLFDVSHMGQAYLKTTEAPLGSQEAHEKIAAAIETLVPGEIRKLKQGGMRYTTLLSEEGGVLDDLMVTRLYLDDLQGMLLLVVNAATKNEDFALIEERLEGVASLEVATDRSLIAIQGPKAAAVVNRLMPGAIDQPFMTVRPHMWPAADNSAYIVLSRCGYTGEDGFEISVPDSHAVLLAKALLAAPEVEPVGLGARDSLRLEAGLCLYGHDLTPEISPVEGNIAFAVGKRRREEGGFPGAARIQKEFAEGPKRLRVGLKPEGRAPAREGAEIQSTDGRVIGAVTSGGFGPTAGGPVAMGYVEAGFAETGTKVNLIVRGKPLPAVVADMPFVPHNYYRG